MFGKKKQTRRRVANHRIDSLVGQQCELRGDLLFRGGLHIDGSIRGNVLAERGSDSLLILSEQGVIEGEIRVPNIILNGAVVGDVYAYEHVELAPQARITGNVYYRTIEMSCGAAVNGSLVHLNELPDEGQLDSDGQLVATDDADHS